MSVPYTPTAWANGVAPAINAANLNNIEAGISALAAVSPPAAYPFIGQLIETELELTPSSTVPVIARWDADHDLANSGAGSSAVAVTAFRAQKMKITAGGSGLTTDFTNVVASAAGSDTNLTFPFTALGIAVVAAITGEGLVAGFLNGLQAATFSADFTTTATQLTINFAGTDYAVIGTTPVSRIVKIAGGAGLGGITNTAIVYPYRIYNDATKARLRRLSGFVPVSAGDYDGALGSGLRCMDIGQGHLHSVTAVAPGGGSALGSTVSGSNQSISTIGAITDGTNGTPRTGKNTSPRSLGMFLYTWLQALV